MNIVGYGGGTDSTAMLVGLWQHHVPVDLILFADPGGEQPHTYHYLRIMDQWLREHGMPGITRVWYTDRQGQRLTLEQECLRSASLLRPLPTVSGCLGQRRECCEDDRL